MHFTTLKAKDSTPSLTKKPTILLIILGIVMFISAFFVVFFLRSPILLPFPWDFFPLISSLNVVLIATPMLWGAWKWLRFKIWILFVMGFYALTIENFAIVTGFPYSSFVYGPFIGSKTGQVPWTVGFSWLPIMILGWLLVINMKSLWKRIIVGAILMMTFDLVLDPGATAASFWIWENNQGFYGVPWMNFFGWIVTSILGLWIWEELLLGIKTTRPTAQQSRWLVISGIVALIFWIGVNLWIGIWIPLIIGLIYLVIATRIIWKRKE